MRSVVWIVFIILLCAGAAANATCIEVVLENASDDFVRQLEFQLLSETGIQLKRDRQTEGGDCATVSVRLIEDVAVIAPSGDSAKPTLLDLSAVAPKYWARSVALTCATLFLENAPPGDDAPAPPREKNNVSEKVAATPPSGDDASPPQSKQKDESTGTARPDKAIRTEPSLPNSPSDQSDVIMSRWAFNVMGGARWVPSYRKNGIGPQLNVGVLYRLAAFMPVMSLVATYHSVPTRTNDRGVQMLGLGGDAALYWKRTITPIFNLHVGASVELLWVRAVGIDASYVTETASNAAVISALGHIRGAIALRPSLRLCLGLSVGWALRSVDVQVSDENVTGIKGVLFGITAGVIFETIRQQPDPRTLQSTSDFPSDHRHIPLHILHE